MQARLVAGDTLDFLTTVSAYPPADGWTLKHRLIPRVASGTVILMTATTSGTDYRTQVGPSTTASWVAGDYGWTSWVEKSGARQVVDAGQVSVLPDPGVAPAGTDFRSQAAKVVDDLRAALATYRATQGHVKQYTIGSRHLEFRDESQIVTSITRALDELALEQRATAMAKGLGDPFRVGIGLRRA